MSQGHVQHVPKLIVRSISNGILGNEATKGRAMAEPSACFRSNGYSTREISQKMFKASEQPPLPANIVARAGPSDRCTEHEAPIDPLSHQLVMTNAIIMPLADERHILQ